MTVTCLTISLVKHCIVKNGRCKFARSTQFLVLFMYFFFQNSDLVIIDFFNHIEKPFLDIIEITQVRYLSREVTLLHFMFFSVVFSLSLSLYGYDIAQHGTYAKIYTQNENVLTFLCITVFVNICSAILKIYPNKILFI